MTIHICMCLGQAHGNVSGNVFVYFSHGTFLCVCLWSACLSACSMRPVVSKFVAKIVITPLSSCHPCVCLVRNTSQATTTLACSHLQEAPLSFSPESVLTGSWPGLVRSVYVKGSTAVVVRVSPSLAAVQVLQGSLALLPGRRPPVA